MCVPNATAIGSGVKLFSDIFSGISSIADGVDNSKYRSQVAINNAINAQNEGKRLEQLGIEESRKEKKMDEEKGKNIIPIDRLENFIETVSDIDLNEYIKNK